MKNRTLTLFLLVSTFAAAFAAEPAGALAPAAKYEAAVKPGDMAPVLKVAEWVKGAPIPRFEPGKVYLVEFWATWCGPCVDNIPHLNALQKKHGKDGLVIIGLTNPDLDAGYAGGRKENNTLRQVRDFVAAQGGKMDYHVAYDTPMRETYKAMMGTLPGIPHAFLIGRDGKLAVDYHPFFLGDAIEKVLAGTWNRERDHPELRRSSKLYAEVMRPKDYAAFKASQAILARDFPALALRTLHARFSQALKAGDHPEVLATGRALMAHTRDSGESKDLAATARAAARDLVIVQRSGVRGLVDALRFDEVRALVAAMAACATDVSNGESSEAFSARAELAYGDGDLPAAVELQRKAVSTAPTYARDTEQKRCDEFNKEMAEQKRLEEFKRRAATPAS